MWTNWYANLLMPKKGCKNRLLGLKFIDAIFIHSLSQLFLRIQVHHQSGEHRCHHRLDYLKILQIWGNMIRRPIVNQPVRVTLVGWSKIGLRFILLWLDLITLFCRVPRLLTVLTNQTRSTRKLIPCTWSFLITRRLNSIVTWIICFKRLLTTSCVFHSHKSSWLHQVSGHVLLG